MPLTSRFIRFACSGTLLGAFVAFSFGATNAELPLHQQTFVAAFEADAAGDPVNLQNQFRTISDRAAKSIVAITVLPTLPDRAAELYAGPLTGDKLSEIAGTVARNVGSGFAIVSGDATSTRTIVTSEHVVSGAAAVFVTLDDGRALPAIVVGSDPRGDVATLRIPVDVPGLKVAESGSVRRGDWCLTVGNPAGLAGQGGLTAAVGTVGAVNRSLPALSRRENRSYADLIQISTPIAPGNSGGPALNLRGEVIGIVCAVVPPGTQGQGVGFAMPLQTGTLARIDRLAHGDEVVYPYLGVNVSDVPFVDDSRSRLAGVRVDEVDARAPADGVVRRGDVVLSVNGHPIPDDDAFSRVIAECAVDEALLLKVLRAGEQVELSVKPRKRELVALPVTKYTASLHWAGATFRTKFEGDRAVGITVVSLDPNCRFARAGLKPGDAFGELLNQPTPDVSQLLDVLWKQASER
jgi:S1-C subfamily serine protease